MPFMCSTVPANILYDFTRSLVPIKCRWGVHVTGTLVDFLQDNKDSLITSKDACWKREVPEVEASSFSTSICVKVFSAWNSFSERCGGRFVWNMSVVSLSNNFLELLEFRAPPMPYFQTELLVLEPCPSRVFPGSGAVALFILLCEFG